MSTDSRIRSAELHEHILKSMYDGVHVIDMNGIVLIENAASEKMLGWTSCNLVGLHGHQTIHHHHADHSDFPAEDCAIYQTITDGIPRTVTDDVFWRQDGSCFPVEYATSPLRDQHGCVYGVTVVFRDISERKRAEKLQNAVFTISQAAHDAENLSELLTTIHQVINDLLPAKSFYVVLSDPDSGLLTFPYFADENSANSSLEPLAQAPLFEKVINSKSVICISPANSADYINQLQQPEINTAFHWLGAPLISEQKGIGALVVQSYDAQKCYSENDKALLQYVSVQVATAIDVQRQRDQLIRMARYDALTNIPNRFLFDDRFIQCLLHAKRYNESFALINIDLDKFKYVNDNFGHAVGDELLQATVQRMRHCVRDSDTIGRVGGDEFLGLLPCIQGSQDVQRVAEALCVALATPFIIQGQTLMIGASIGIAIYPTDGINTSTLKCAADNAMYEAKRNGGGQFRFSMADL